MARTEMIAKLEIYLDNVTDACSDEGSYQVDNVNTPAATFLGNNFGYTNCNCKTIVLLISPPKAHSHDMTGSYSCLNGVSIPVDLIWLCGKLLHTKSCRFRCREDECSLKASAMGATMSSIDSNNEPAGLRNGVGCYFL